MIEPRYRWQFPDAIAIDSGLLAAAERHGLDERVAGLLARRGLLDGRGVRQLLRGAARAASTTRGSCRTPTSFAARIGRARRDRRADPRLRRLRRRRADRPRDPRRSRSGGSGIEVDPVRPEPARGGPRPVAGRGRGRPRGGRDGHRDGRLRDDEPARDRRGAGRRDRRPRHGPSPRPARSCRRPSRSSTRSAPTAATRSGGSPAAASPSSSPSCSSPTSPAARRRPSR